MLRQMSKGVGSRLLPEGVAVMYARNVKMNLKPNTASQFSSKVQQDLLPLLRKRNGFADELAFVAADGSHAVAISLWNTQEDAEAYGRETYPEVLKGLATLIDGTPEVSGFNVANSTFHKIVAQS
jgi:hypothetical protein